MLPPNRKLPVWRADYPSRRGGGGGGGPKVKAESFSPERISLTYFILHPFHPSHDFVPVI